MIRMSEYAKRRKVLMQHLGTKGIAVIPSAQEYFRNGDAYFPFRQNSNFYYLSGFQEPEAVIVLVPKRKEGEYILFNRVRDRDREIWDGPRAGQDGAIKDYMADQAFPIDTLSELLPSLLEGREKIFYPLGLNGKFDHKIIHFFNELKAKVRSGVTAPQGIVDVSQFINEMRVIKSEAEINTMQKAVDITTAAHIRAMEICKPGMNEYELEAAIHYEFNRAGAKFPAYTSIVGSGRNSCILHYINNNKIIEDGDLVLIDAGAEYETYAADITRTFPANGKFSKPQKLIYELVLKAQLAGINEIKPGALWTNVQKKIVKIMTQGLVDLGILKGDVKSLIESNAYFQFYMHRSGHYLGLDVHDAGAYRINEKWRTFEPGMVLTVEPGIYISEDNKNVDAKWHNIGVRIEDDVYVTKTGKCVLSSGIPKTIPEIEAIMHKKKN